MKYYINNNEIIYLNPGSESITHSACVSTVQSDIRATNF